MILLHSCKGRLALTFIGFLLLSGLDISDARRGGKKHSPKHGKHHVETSEEEYGSAEIFTRRHGHKSSKKVAESSEEDLKSGSSEIVSGKHVHKSTAKSLEDDSGSLELPAEHVKMLLKGRAFGPFTPFEPFKPFEPITHGSSEFGQNQGNWNDNNNVNNNANNNFNNNDNNNVNNNPNNNFNNNDNNNVDNNPNNNFNDNINGNNNPNNNLNNDNHNQNNINNDQNNINIDQNNINNDQNNINIDQNNINNDQNNINNDQNNINNNQNNNNQNNNINPNIPLNNDHQVCGLPEPDINQVCISVKLPWKIESVYFCTPKENIQMRECKVEDMTETCFDDARNDSLKVATPWDCCPHISIPNSCDVIKCPPEPFNRTCTSVLKEGDCCKTFYCDREDPMACKILRTRPSCTEPPVGKENCTRFKDPYGCCTKFECDYEKRPGYCPKTTLGVKMVSKMATNAEGKQISIMVPQRVVSAVADIRCIGDNFCPDEQKCCANTGVANKLRPDAVGNENKTRPIDGVCRTPVFSEVESEPQGRRFKNKHGRKFGLTGRRLGGRRFGGRSFSGRSFSGRGRSIGGRSMFG